MLLPRIAARHASTSAAPARPAAPASVAHTPQGASLDARRARSRRNLAPNKGSEEMSWTLPRERPGLDYELNWSLARMNVSPQGDAHRNAEPRRLVAAARRSTLRVDATTRAVSPVSEAVAAVHHTVAVPHNATERDEHDAAFRALGRAARGHLSAHNHPGPVYVHDGALGAASDVEVRVRAVTDDPVTALWLHHMLPRVSLATAPAMDFTHTVSAFLTPEMPASADAREPVVAVHVPLGHVVSAAGADGRRASLAALQAALVAAAAPRWADAGWSLISGATVVDAHGRTTLVMGPAGVALERSGAVAGAHHHLLGWPTAGAVGLHRVWAGLMSAGAAATPMAVVERRAGADALVTRPLATVGSAPLARAVVSVAGGAKSPKAVKPAELVRALVANDAYVAALHAPVPPTQPPSQWAEQVERALVEGKVECHTVAAEASRQDLGL